MSNCAIYVEKKGNLCIVDQRVFRFYLKECILSIQLTVSFNFGLDHQFNCTSQLTFNYNRSLVQHYQMYNTYSDKLGLE